MNYNNDILENILNISLENSYNQNKINRNIDINYKYRNNITKIWNNISIYILQENINFIKDNIKLLKVNTIWKKLVYNKIKNIFDYIIKEKLQKKTFRAINFNIPLIYSNEYIISYILNHYSFEYLIDSFTNYKNIDNNLILKVPEPADYFNMNPRCEQCRYSIYNVNFLKKFQFINKTNIIVECDICYYKQYWLDKVIQYINEGYSHIIVNKIKKIINIITKCDKCRKYEICLYHKIDYKYYDIYKLFINKYNEKNYFDCKKISINSCKIN